MCFFKIIHNIKNHYSKFLLGRKIFHVVTTPVEFPVIN